VGGTSHFLALNVNISKMVGDMPKSKVTVNIELLYKQILANFVKRTSTLEHPVLQTFNSECFLNLLLYSMCVRAAFGELKICRPI